MKYLLAGALAALMFFVGKEVFYLIRVAQYGEWVLREPNRAILFNEIAVGGVVIGMLILAIILTLRGGRQ